MYVFCGLHYVLTNLKHGDRAGGRVKGVDPLALPTPPPIFSGRDDKQSATYHIEMDYNT